MNLMSGTEPRIVWMRTSPELVGILQVDLRDVAGDHGARVHAHAGEEHLHLPHGRVLRLVEDHERVVERAPAHERERRDLDHAELDVAAHLVVTT